MAAMFYATSDSESNAYREVAKFLQQTAQRGDVVVVTPEWNPDPLRHFRDVGLPVLPAASAAIGLQAGAARIWVVSPDWATSPRPTGPRLRLLEGRTISGIQVALFAADRRPEGGAGNAIGPFAEIATVQHGVTHFCMGLEP